MGLHVFFGCYFNLFRLMAKCGVLENLLLKEVCNAFRTMLAQVSLHASKRTQRFVTHLVADVHSVCQELEQNDDVRSQQLHHCFT